MTDNGVSGKTALIIGASGGLGRTVASVFEKSGAKTITGNMPQGEMWFDAAKEEVARGVLDNVEKIDDIDFLLHLAGGYEPQPFISISEEAPFNRMMRINFTTAQVMMRLVLPGMLKRKRGRVILMGARQGLHGMPGNAAYGASKAALINLAQTAAAETHGTGVTVNVIAPTIIDTPLNREAMPREDFSKWVAPEDIVELMIFLCSESGRAINGAIIPVGGP